LHPAQDAASDLLLLDAARSCLVHNVLHRLLVGHHSKRIEQQWRLIHLRFAAIGLYTPGLLRAASAPFGEGCSDLILTLVELLQEGVLRILKILAVESDNGTLSARTAMRYWRNTADTQRH
jgi:hypothetical protein